MRNPSPCARLAVPGLGPSAASSRQGPGLKVRRLRPGPAPRRRDAGASIRLAAGPGAGSSRRSGAPRPADARRGPVRAPRKARGAGRAGPPSRDAREAAGGARGARARAKLGREAPLLTGSCERSQHGVSQRAASAGLPGAAGPANGKHIGYPKEGKKKGGAAKGRCFCRHRAPFSNSPRRASAGLGAACRQSGRTARGHAGDAVAPFSVRPPPLTSRRGYSRSAPSARTE